MKNCNTRCAVSTLAENKNGRHSAGLPFCGGGHLFSKRVPVANDSFNPLVEIRQVKALVRRMQPVVGKAKPQHNRINPQHLLQRRHDWNRAALTIVDGRVLKDLFQNNSRGPHVTGVEIDQRAITSMQALCADGDLRRRDFPKVGL